VTDADHYRELMRPVFGGRKLIVAADVLQGAASAVPSLREVGAQRPFLLAGNVGTGPLPSAEEGEQLVLGLTPEPTVMGGIRTFEDAMGRLPPDAIAALDAYDPGREALVLGSFFTRQGTVAGRPVYGGRHESWEALEDKTVIDVLFDAAGIDRAPSEVVPLGDARRVSQRLDAGDGTAWAGDARGGWWGGAAYFRWVRTEDDAAEAQSFFATECDRVRVMPFLEGIPCSIHGCVFDDDETAFRPVEMLTLRRRGTNRLHYTGVATYWDPPDADREAMREAARRVGRWLRERVDYRGLFTLDGVLTVDGFLPTELNPRPGAGLSPLAAASSLNVFLLNKLIVEREPADYRPDDFEHLMISNGDETRGGGCFTLFGGERNETSHISVAKRGGKFVVVPEGEPGDGVLMFGPSTAGSMVRYQPDVALVPRGPSFAATAAEIFAFTDAEFETGLGPLEPARSVR
jgi:hypothetical protein